MQAARSARATTELQRLNHLVASFVATAAESSFSDVRALQRPPHGSLAYGATGVVSVLMHQAACAACPIAWSAAKRWMGQVTASRAHTLVGLPDEGNRHDRASLWFGAPGIHYARALMALADPGASSLRPVRAFVQHASVALEPEQPADLVLGAAGNLIAVNLLRRLHSSAGLERLARRLAERVAASIWAFESNWSFAHGWPGMAFALLQEAQVSGQPVPGDLARRLRHLASREVPQRSDVARGMSASWCNGAAGQILLWVKAFELLRHGLFLERACTDAARIPRRADRANHMLCCGTAGWGYAFLGLERANPGNGWYERAVDVCMQSVDADPVFEHASGLLKGYSGLLYLAIDLLHDTPSCGFPFVEVIPTGPHRS